MISFFRGNYDSRENRKPTYIHRPRFAFVFCDFRELWGSPALFGVLLLARVGCLMCVSLLVTITCTARRSTSTWGRLQSTFLFSPGPFFPCGKIFLVYIGLLVFMGRNIYTRFRRSNPGVYNFLCFCEIPWRNIYTGAGAKNKPEQRKNAGATKKLEAPRPAPRTTSRKRQR